MVNERHWLDEIPYTKWGGNDSLPHLQEGQTFMPSQLLLKEVCLPYPAVVKHHSVTLVHIHMLIALHQTAAMYVSHKQ